MSTHPKHATLRTTTPEIPGIEERRAGYDAFLARELPADVRVAAGLLGPRPTLELVPDTVPDEQARLLYLHGGAFVLGSPAGYAGFTAQIARRAAIRTVSLDYRLAPEHPFPAAVDDGLAAYRDLLDQGTPPSRIVLAGDSAGGNLVLATLLAARRAGLSMPAGAVLMSPVTDLAMTGASMRSKNGVDPIFTPEFLAEPFAAYLAGADPRSELASPLVADLHGLPELLIQVGSYELLLDDSTRLAARAAEADVPVTLEVFAQAPHVFQINYETSAAADAALDGIARFIRRVLGQTGTR
jgi:monoterpene epsilon-lactone hydrolase